MFLCLSIKVFGKLARSPSCLNIRLDLDALKDTQAYQTIKIGSKNDKENEFYYKPPKYLLY